VPKSSKAEKGGSTHPTIKPVALMSYLVTMGSREGDTILDPFAGSFTTGIAAHILRRDYILIEQDEEYFRQGNKRLQKYTDQERIF